MRCIRIRNERTKRVPQGGHTGPVRNAFIVIVIEMEFSLIQRLECIGRGSYGDVHRGLTNDGVEVAIKLINLEDV